jgi:spore maturation protein SpmB
MSGFLQRVHELGWGGASSWLLALIIVGVPVYGFTKGVKVYEAFVEGAKEGFAVALRILPYLVAILAAVGAFRAAGAMDALSNLLAPITGPLGIPPQVLPLALVRPFSGSGATGILAGIFSDPALGPDSYAGRLGSMLQGSTETTFYVLSVYCGAVAITKYRHALVAGLAADLTGFTASVLIAHFIGRHFWG